MTLNLQEIRSALVGLAGSKSMIIQTDMTAKELKKLIKGFPFYSWRTVPNGVKVTGAPIITGFRRVE